MDTDESRPVVRRPRKVARAGLAGGPVRDLRDAIYRLYAEADHPRLDELATVIAADDRLDGSPKKDLISKIIGGGGSASQQDTVTVAIVLARVAGRVDTAAVAAHVRQLWLAAQTMPPPSPPARLGRSIADCDPLALEVHPTIKTDSDASTAGWLPTYVVRAHDRRMRQVAERVIGGSSAMVTLVPGWQGTWCRWACGRSQRHVPG